MKSWVFSAIRYYKEIKNLILNFDIQDSSNLFQYSLTGNLDFGISNFIYKYKLRKYIKENVGKNFINKVFLLIELSVTKGDSFFYYVENIDNYRLFKYNNLNVEDIKAEEFYEFLKQFNIKDLSNEGKISLKDCLIILLKESSRNPSLNSYVQEQYNNYFKDKPFLIKVFLSLCFHKNKIFEFVSFFQKEFNLKDNELLDKRIKELTSFHCVYTIQSRSYATNFYKDYYDYNILPLNYLDILNDFNLKEDLIKKLKEYFDLYTKYNNRQVEKEIKILIEYCEKIILRKNLEVSLTKEVKLNKKICKV